MSAQSRRTGADELAPARTHVMLSGGLGNQLFQCSAALDVSCGNAVVLWPDLGAPRRHDGIAADLLRIPLPERVTVGQLSVSGPLRWLAKRAANYMLRIGVIGSAIERDARYRKLAAWAAAIALAPALRATVQVRASIGIGLDQVATAQGVAQPLLLGYFQSWRHVMAPGVRELLADGLAAIEEPWFDEMSHLADEESPIIVHVRLGDYRKEPGLGLIEPEYYAAALAEARAILPHSRIWLFSDEPEEAMRMLPPGTPQPRVIDPQTPQTHPADLMRVMTLGRAYVLANSTFGWWAAMLARDPEATVTVPDPWFVVGDQPLEQIPPTWQRRSRVTGAEVSV